MEEIQAEEKEYKSIPIQSKFESSDSMERILTLNFNQVKIDVDDMIDDLKKFFVVK